MKRKLLVMVSLWAALPLSAQRFMRTDDFTLLDEGVCSVSYEVSYVIDSTKTDEKEKDVFRLDIGERWSKSYSYALFRYDSICTMRTLKGQDVLGGADTWFFMEVYKDRWKHEMTVTHRAYDIGPVFKYRDPSDVLMDWTFSDEVCTILGYRCRKAVCRFRGRTWTAWFAPEIPISDGPWKFAGLPGLVLKVEDDREHYSFSCIAIRNKVQPIAMWNYDYKETTREETWKFDQDCYAICTTMRYALILMPNCWQMRWMRRGEWWRWRLPEAVHTNWFGLITLWNLNDLGASLWDAMTITPIIQPNEFPYGKKMIQTIVRQINTKSIHPVGMLAR